MAQDAIYGVIVFLVFAGRICGGVQWHRWNAKSDTTESDAWSELVGGNSRGDA